MGSVGAGLWNKRSFPVPVLGNAITSRIVSVLQRMDMRRSKPIAAKITIPKKTMSKMSVEIRRKESMVCLRTMQHKEWCAVLEGKG